MSFIETKEFLTWNLSFFPSRWTWGHGHVNDYANLPWSRTALKFFFHRTAVVPGNTNTLNVSKIINKKNLDSGVLSGMASANLRMQIEFAKDPKDDISYISADTGQNGNPFQGSYFNLNEKHIKGELLEMKWTEEKQKGTKFNTLYIMPKQKNVSNSAD